MTTEFNAESGKWQVKIVGTGLRDSADAGEMSDLQIGGVSQEIESHSDTMAVFNIIDVQTLTITDIYLFFPVGLPAGHEIVRAGFTLEPRFMSMTPNVGSVGGTFITAMVPGIGKGYVEPEKNLNLVNAADGQDVCMQNSVVVEEYGKISCWSERTNFGVEPITV